MSASMEHRDWLRSPAAIFCFMLVVVLLASCSRRPTVAESEFPTFVPPGMIDNQVDLGREGTLSTDIPEIGAIANYNFDVVLDYYGHRVQVTQLVEVINPGPDVWTEIVFFLPIDLQTTRFSLGSVRLQDQVETAVTQLKFTPDGFLTLRLSQELNPHESRLVNITYGL